MKSFLKIVGLSAAVVLAFACKKSEGPVSALGEGQYAVESISLTAKSGHEKELEDFVRSMETALEVRYEKDSAAIVVIDSIVNQNNFKYISGVFHLQKGTKEGVKDNLKRYEMRVTGYNLLSTIEARIDYRSSKLDTAKTDKEAFVKDLDSLQMRMAATEDQGKMESEISTFQAKWNGKKKVAAFLAFCKDYDTVGTYSIGFGKGVVKDTVVGFSSFTWKTKNDSVKVIPDLKNDMKKVAEEIANAGLMKLEAAYKYEEVAAKYSNMGVAGRLYVFRSYYDTAQQEWSDWGEEESYKTLVVSQSGLEEQTYGVTIKNNVTRSSSYLTKEDFYNEDWNEYSYGTGHAKENYDSIVKVYDEFQTAYELACLQAVSWRDGYNYPAYEKDKINLEGWNSITATLDTFYVGTVKTYQKSKWCYSVGSARHLLGLLYDGSVSYYVSGYADNEKTDWKEIPVTKGICPLVVFESKAAPEDVVKYDGAQNDISKDFCSALKHAMCVYMFPERYYDGPDREAEFVKWFKYCCNKAWNWVDRKYSDKGQKLLLEKFTGTIKGQYGKLQPDVEYLYSPTWLVQIEKPEVIVELPNWNY